MNGIITLFLLKLICFACVNIFNNIDLKKALANRVLSFKFVDRLNNFQERCD
jgi:hypothetical protein